MIKLGDILFYTGMVSITIAIMYFMGSIFYYTIIITWGSWDKFTSSPTSYFFTLFVFGFILVFISMHLDKR